ncbi:hypothetical protein C4D60_Mb08t12490 [Musa balbisiana]|uniref:Uncharacterized protein n=1 Tax=Musa balbisiana TaxID=52838 RepID=A0A4S8K390_MUSBA|nr:hypothetical protein C4D60_Mb08t12490 [Musa balbisiana]
MERNGSEDAKPYGFVVGCFFLSSSKTGYVTKPIVLSILSDTYLVRSIYVELITRFSEFGVDGGPAAKSLWPKDNLFMKHVSSHLGIVVPHVEMKHVIASTIFLKGFGGLLFIFSSSFGAYLLVGCQLSGVTPWCAPAMASTRSSVPSFHHTSCVRLLQLRLVEKPEFVQLFSKFAQNLALFGALLFFIGMKNSIPSRQPKKVPKSKNKLN